MKHLKALLPQVVSKTAVFIAVVLFIVLFKTIFHEENTFVGVTTLVLTLVFLSDDLTAKPLKNLFTLIGGNMVLGLGTFCITQNVWIGVPINFILMFLIGYTFSYELKKPVNMLVGLHYILLLTTPVTLEQLPLRLWALVAGACMVMGAQLLVNKHKLTKESQQVFGKLQNGLLTKIAYIEEKKDTTGIHKEIEAAIRSFKLTIFHSEKKEATLPALAMLLTNQVSCVEKINNLLEKEAIRTLNPACLEALRMAVVSVGEATISAEELLSGCHKYDAVVADTAVWQACIQTLAVLHRQVQEMQDMATTKQGTSYAAVDVAQAFENMPIFHKQAAVSSNRVAYGMRLGILVALTTFMVAKFQIVQGQWVIYTVFALTQPYQEFTQVKAKKRVFGTVVGAVVLAILFAVVKDPMMRTVAVIIAGYLMAYVSDYKYLVILITINAVAAASISMQNANPIILQRLMYVGCGVVLALLANKMIFPRTYKEEATKLQTLQQTVVEALSVEVTEKNSLNEKMIQKLYLTQALIENRMHVIGLEVKEEVVHTYKKTINELHQNYLLKNRAESI